jgi:Spy/CpxP family protein refolding chaperone
MTISLTSRRLLLTAGAMLAASFVSVAPAAAQQGPPPAGAGRQGAQAGPMRRGPMSVDDRVQRMTTQLGLTPDQATKVRAALVAEQRQADSILAARARARDAERSAMLAMRTGTEKSLSAILTPEQRTKHDAMRARGGRGGGGQVRGGERPRGRRAGWRAHR